LENECIKLRPEYQSIVDKVRNSKRKHFDETEWKVQKEEQGNYGWVMSPIQ
jgi:hypothetical protein